MPTVPRMKSHGPRIRIRFRSMTEAYVVDAIRTPMGAYRGALSGVRPDDLAAHVIRAVVERTGVDPERIADVYFGAANQSGEDNRDVARMAALLAGLPAERSRRHRQPPLRLRPGGDQRRRPRGQARRGRLLPGRRGRVDEPGALGGGEARARPAPRPADDARHDPGLAHDQPADGRARGLDRVDGRDRRERRRALRDQPRGPGRLRPAQPPARGRRRRGRALRRGDRPDRGAEGPRDRHRRRRRGPAPRRLAGEARRAAPGLPRGRHRHRRQRLDPQRRRRLPADRLRGGGAESSAPSRWPASSPSASPASTPPTWGSARSRRSPAPSPPPA